MVNLHVLARSLTTAVCLWSSCVPTTTSSELPLAPITTAVSPGFGFDLGPSFVAASVRHVDGNFESYSFPIDDTRYQEFFKDVSSGRERCRWDWVRGVTQQPLSAVAAFEDPGHQPANDILARAIGSARDSLQNITGLFVDKAFVSNPKLPALCNEDIEAAMRLLGIQVIRNSRVILQPSECSTAYASYGRGLCHDYTRRNPCEYEERYELPLRVVMVATYNDGAFLIEHKHVRYAFSTTWQVDSLIDWQAGAEALHIAPDPRMHWDRIRVMLLDRPLYWQHHVDVIMLAGQHGSNATLSNIVKETFAKLQTTPPEILVENGEFTGAMGAAEFAFRAQYQH